MSKRSDYGVRQIPITLQGVKKVRLWSKTNSDQKGVKKGRYGADFGVRFWRLILAFDFLLFFSTYQAVKRKSISRN